MFEPALSAAAHRPNLAAHIDELKATPRQLAERLPIARENRRHRAMRRVFDFMTIGRIEVLHGTTKLFMREMQRDLYRSLDARSNEDQNCAECIPMTFVKFVRIDQTRSFSAARDLCGGIQAQMRSLLSARRQLHGLARPNAPGGAVRRVERRIGGAASGPRSLSAKLDVRTSKPAFAPPMLALTNFA
jgi:hypothetical protein